MNAINYPPEIALCIDRLEGAGESAYIVGGAVRDGLLGRRVGDYDVTTSATPEKTMALFSDFRTIPTGLAHGTVTVRIGDVPIEITTYRIDGAYRDARHPESVTFTDRIEDDLARRDFTVNAMAYNARRGLLDPFGGSDDLRARLLRCVGDAETRFSEDALRILRAFRFASQLDFSIEDGTLAAAADRRAGLAKIARERIGAEMKKLLAGDAGAVARSLSLMEETRVFDALFGRPMPTVGDKIAHTEERDPLLRLAVLTFPLGDDHAAVLSSLRLSNAETKTVARLCRAGGETVPDATPRDARRFLARYGDLREGALRMQALFAGENEEFARAVRAAAAENPCLSVADLALTGTDLLPRCPDHPEAVGDLLQALLEHVIDVPTDNTKERLLAWLSTRN